MGAIADFFVAYAQPLLDCSDGSLEDTRKAFGLAQVCMSLAQLPLAEREKFIERMQDDMDMDDEEFAEFRSGLLEPMINRYVSAAASARVFGNYGYTEHSGPDRESPRLKATADRYAPCTCQSGKKYKFCCGAKVTA